MHQHGTNTGTKLKLPSGGKLLCSHAGKLSPKCGAEGSCLAPVSTVLEEGHWLSLGKIMSLCFGCQTPGQAAPFRVHMDVSDVPRNWGVRVGVPAFPGMLPKELLAGRRCLHPPPAPRWVLKSSRSGGQHGPSCSAERRPLC